MAASVASVKIHGAMFLVPLLLQQLLLLLLLLSNYSTAAGVHEHVHCVEKERDVLLELKAGLVMDDSSLLPSWNSDDHNSDCCQWKRVTCNKQTGHVEVLDLNGFDQLRPFRGEISSSLMELHHLHYLNLSSNWFLNSPVPEFISSLTNLRILDLQSSYFGGRIPDSLATLSHLQYLDLSRNNLEGTIPPHLGNLSHLQYLDLSYNHLVGAIPHQLGSLTDLRELYLGFNQGGLKIDDKRGQWLSNLTLLTHLDLSWVLNLNYSHGWLQTIGMLPKLEWLKLSYCDLSDLHLLSLSPSVHNFSTSLAVLDLSMNAFTSSMIFPWVFNAIPNLKDLDLSFSLSEEPIQYDFGSITNSLELLDLSGSTLTREILESLMNVCTLHSLSLNQMIILNQDISTFLLNMSGCARYSLQELLLVNNQITGTLPDLSIFPSLHTLDLSNNRLSGKLQEGDKFPPKLESLWIESNSLEGGIPKSFGNICTLRSLHLSNNNLSKELSMIIHDMSAGCAKYSLQELIMASNQMTGNIIDMSNFQSLQALDLSHNLLNGKIPENIQFPSQLQFLYMEFNNFEGVISDSHLANMSMLRFVDFSYNSLALIFSENWVPPFQLQSIYLSSCRLGPNFPKWLQTQKYLQDLDISNTGISDVVPMWFWAQTTRLNIMNISYNNLTGTIPNLPIRFSQECQVILTSNKLEGSIPSFLRSAALLHLSHNKFSRAHTLLCTRTNVDRLGVLDLSKNKLIGHLPDCWSSFKTLEFLDLSDNTLSGEVPFSLGSLLQLQVLILRNNSFIGTLPFSLKNCKKLMMVDLGENRLSGPIPSWIGIMGQQLQMLSLRRNHFSGSLPPDLCYLTNLQLLDLSMNNLSGEILKCLKNFTAMSQKDISTRTAGTYYYYSSGFSAVVSYKGYDLIALLMWKGSEQVFKNNMLILKSIDLSSNQLTGDIPKEIGNLVELVSLNLSRNNLTGQIPSEIGRLTSLDFLDLSRNHFIGSVPPSFAQIDRLSVLNLSYNNLSGKIPISTQLQSFDASSFEGNADLCGKPLDKKCPGDEEEPQDPETVDKSSSEDNNHIYLSAALGFITGFWGILGSLLLNRTWRHAYFLYLNNIIDKLYIITAVNTAKFQRWLKGLLDNFVRVSPGD